MQYIEIRLLQLHGELAAISSEADYHRQICKYSGHSPKPLCEALMHKRVVAQMRIVGEHSVDFFALAGGEDFIGI